VRRAGYSHTGTLYIWGFSQGHWGAMGEVPWAPGERIKGLGGSYVEKTGQEQVLVTGTLLADWTADTAAVCGCRP
jgi:hypothetical protein